MKKRGIIQVMAWACVLAFGLVGISCAVSHRGTFPEHLAERDLNPNDFADVITTVRPLLDFEITQLKSEEEIDQDKLASAISKATGMPVKKFVFVSLQDSKSRALWEYPASEDDDNSFSVSITLSFAIYVHFFDRVRDPLDYDVIKDTHKMLEHLWPQEDSYVGRNIYGALFYYLLAVEWKNETDDASAKCELEPLLEQMRHAMPIAEKRNHPGVWIVLVK